MALNFEMIIEIKRIKIEQKKKKNKEIENSPYVIF